jgi:hypothetical protein
MTRTIPRRLIILHLAQILRTEDLTFINRIAPQADSYSKSQRSCGLCGTAATRMTTLLVAIDDPASCQIIRRKLDSHFVTGKDPYKILPHFARNVRKNAVFVFQLNPEHCIRERLNDRRNDLDCFFLCHELPKSSNYKQRSSSAAGNYKREPFKLRTTAPTTQALLTRP